MPPPFPEALFSLTGDATEGAGGSGLPLFQRGNEGDLATFAWVAASEIPPSPPLQRGEPVTERTQLFAV